MDAEMVFSKGGLGGYFTPLQTGTVQIREKKRRALGKAFSKDSGQRKNLPSGEGEPRFRGGRGWGHGD